VGAENGRQEAGAVVLPFPGGRAPSAGGHGPVPGAHGPVAAGQLRSITGEAGTVPEFQPGPAAPDELPEPGLSLAPIGDEDFRLLSDHSAPDDRQDLPGMPETQDHDSSVSGATLGLVGAAPTGRRVRARLARFNAPWQSSQVSEALEPLIGQHRNSHPKADIRLLQRAYDTAEQWHRGQYRKSGDPYITHPLAVANILADLGMDTTTLIAALLHDTIEDTDYDLDRMRLDFGGEVALLVEGVTKLDRVKLGDAAKAETIRKMVVAMAKDPRVLVIKLADRLHNMRTLTFLPRAKQEQKAK
jgi:GTP pyrophosphokinase